MSSSSSSSRPINRRHVYGVPTRYWCGNNLKTFASKTKENPCRRFYRCVIASQRETEDHLFKWEDEALLDEIRMVDAKRLDLIHDLQTLSKTVLEKLAGQESNLCQLKQELRHKFLQTSHGIDALMETTNLTTPPAVETTHTRSPRLADATSSHQSSHLRNIVVAFAVLGTAAWLCSKTT